MADVMPQLGKEGLNADPTAWAAVDLRRPLFARDAWFARLHAACFADVAAVTLTGSAGSSHYALHLLEPRPGALIALANWYSFRWMPQLDQQSPSADGDALTAAFMNARQRAHRITLSPVAEADGVAELLRLSLRRAGWTIGTATVSRNHWLDTDGRSFADWWAQRPGRLRSTVQRKNKKGAVTCVIHTNFSDALWDEYQAVYAASWKPTEGSPAFLRDWARDAAGEGALRLGIARIDGRAVAAQFWTVDAGTAHIHKLAQISEDTVDAYSPGTLLSHAMFAHAFDVDKVERIDFGTGDDSYKRDWMEQSADLVTITAVDLRQPRGWWSLARNGLTRVAGRLHKS